MGKFKVTWGTWTCWSQETKQANFELEDGRVLGIRVMHNKGDVYEQGLRPSVQINYDFIKRYDECWLWRYLWD